MASDITSAWLASPSDEDSAGGTDEVIVDLKETFVETIDKEHYVNTAEASPQPRRGTHLAGSAISYAQAAAPTLKPDGSAALDAYDHGRLWIDTDDNRLKYWKWASGSGAWTDVLVGQAVKVIIVASSAPTSPAPAEGMHWLDTTNNVEKVYTGGAWVVLSGKVPQSAPASPANGDIWIV